MKSNSLVLENIVIARGHAALTPPINLSLKQGEMLLVRGRNGSGKSTFLKTLAGLLPPASGSVTYNNQPYPSHPPLYLGHRRGLTPGMSVYDNVAFWGKVSGFPELIPAAMHYFELADVADAPLETLSAGWQQRVALTRLITLQSTYWFLDEPIANLDDEGTALLQSLIEARLQQGGIIVLATHSAMQGEMIRILNLNTIASIAQEEELN